MPDRAFGVLVGVSSARAVAKAGPLAFAPGHTIQAALGAIGQCDTSYGVEHVRRTAASVGTAVQGSVSGAPSCSITEVPVLG